MAKNTMLQEMSEIKTDVAVLKEKFLNMEKTLSKIDKAISGNGQPGLIQKWESNEIRLDNHLIKDASWKGDKEGSINNLKYILGIGLTVLGLLATAFKFFI